MHLTGLCGKLTSQNKKMIYSFLVRARVCFLLFHLLLSTWFLKRGCVLIVLLVLVRQSQRLFNILRKKIQVDISKVLPFFSCICYYSTWFDLCLFIIVVLSVVSPRLFIWPCFFCLDSFCLTYASFSHLFVCYYLLSNRHVHRAPPCFQSLS